MLHVTISAEGKVAPEVPHADQIALPEAGEPARIETYFPDVLDKVDLSAKRPCVAILPGGAYARVSAREAEPTAARLRAILWRSFRWQERLPISSAMQRRSISTLAISSLWDSLREHIWPWILAASGMSPGFLGVWVPLQRRCVPVASSSAIPSSRQVHMRTEVPSITSAATTKS